MHVESMACHWACAGLASQQWSQKKTAARSAGALVELNADALSPEQAQQIASQLMQAKHPCNPPPVPVISLTYLKAIQPGFCVACGLPPMYRGAG